MFIDQGRLWDSLMAMAEIGRTPEGGACRLALTDEDRAARDLFVTWCLEAGCRTTWDRFGNIFAVRAGESEAPLVLTGSHLDTQPNGGHFDGILGVLAGLEVIRSLNDREQGTRRPIAVVNWTNEEGARFPTALSGSKGFSGAAPAEEVLAMAAVDGPVFEAELARIGYAGDESHPRPEVGAYVELHIEQGPVLFEAGEAVALVDGVQAAWRFEIEIFGADRHAGTTPADARADSFMAAASFACRARALSLAESPQVRFTVGRMEVRPGSPNTVPGQTFFTVDLRHPDEDLLGRLEGAYRELLGEIDREERTASRLTRVMRVPTVAFDAALVDRLAALECAPKRRMMSGAMHDACMMAPVAPTAMIFARCRDGISHSHEESMTPDDAGAACDLLFRAVVDCAGGA